MPILPNPRHERFCLLRLEGKTATEAYVGAGYSANGAGQSGHRMLKNAEIGARIQELRDDVAARVALRTVVSESFVIAGLMRIAGICGNPSSARWNPGAAIRALELLGRTRGLFDKRRPPRATSYDGMTLAQVDARLEELDREIAELEAKLEQGKRSKDGPTRH